MDNLDLMTNIVLTCCGIYTLYRILRNFFQFTPKPQRGTFTQGMAQEYARIARKQGLEVDEFTQSLASTLAMLTSYDLKHNQEFDGNTITYKRNVSPFKYTITCTIDEDLNYKEKLDEH